MNLERILKQHKEILKLSNEIEEYINKLEVQNSDKNLLSEILLKKSFLMGKLKVHLLTEEILYSFIIQLRDILHNLKNRISKKNQNVYSKIEK
jgi:Hemerythrin HHE cation binding domain.